MWEVVEVLEFEFRTGRVRIDLAKCKECSTLACVKACSLYGRGILRVKGGLPALAVPEDEARRLCIECLACEVQCHLHGNHGASIELPMPEG
ncbi:MAG: hypothetical protein DRN96_06620 [Thermoproteota archaeon]|nr:MAG: hypothetical protein DRN96_06620 [Candidatus Korarchaeota archaeon]RLG54095.1 MAG: hypothetical protein DRN99_05680 [Candidatus Korarchaeota archaeon]